MSSIKNFDELVESVTRSRKRMRVYRENRRDMLRQYVGKHYSDGGTGERVPLNLLELAVNIYCSNLTGGVPKADVACFERELKPVAYMLELALDHLSKEIGLASTLRSALVESMFTCGIVKVGLTTGTEVELRGRRFDVGQPFADNVSFDNFVLDMTATEMDGVDYMGDRMELDFEMAMDSGLYDKKVLERIGGDSTSRGIDVEDGYRARDIGSGEGSQYGDTTGRWRDRVAVWELFLPKDNMVVCYAEANGEKLAEREWAGPENGPYHMLFYNEVPSNILPLSPMSLLMDLHELTNRVFTKLGRQADRQKTFTVVGPGAGSDGQRIVNVNDGEVIRVDDPGKVKEFTTGGPNQINMAFASTLRQYFSYFGGNLDSIGGLGAQAETVGQEKLISENSSRRLTLMRRKVLELAKNVMTDLGFYLWTDPMIELPLVKRIEGTDLEMPFTLTPELMEGDYYDYHIDVKPYSLVDITPAEKVAAMMEYLNFLSPYAPLLQQQGIELDFAKLTELYAKARGLDELSDIVKYAGGESNYLEDVEDKMSAPVKIRDLTKKYEHTYKNTGGMGAMEAGMMSAGMGAQGPSQMGDMGSMAQGTEGLA